MSNPTEKKQNYLFEEIIGQGYDPESFMNFMAESKEDGTNIDKWGMAELINIVQQYKESFSKTGENIANLEILLQPPIQEKVYTPYANDGLKLATEVVPLKQDTTNQRIESVNRNVNIPSNQIGNNNSNMPQRQQQTSSRPINQFTPNTFTHTTIQLPPVKTNILDDEDPFASIPIKTAPNISLNQSNFTSGQTPVQKQQQQPPQYDQDLSRLKNNPPQNYQSQQQQQQKQQQHPQQQQNQQQQQQMQQKQRQQQQQQFGQKQQQNMQPNIKSNNDIWNLSRGGDKERSVVDDPFSLLCDVSIQPGQNQTQKSQTKGDDDPFSTFYSTSPQKKQTFQQSPPNNQSVQQANSRIVQTNQMVSSQSYSSQQGEQHTKQTPQTQMISSPVSERYQQGYNVDILTNSYTTQVNNQNKGDSNEKNWMVNSSSSPSKYNGIHLKQVPPTNQQEKPITPDIQIQGEIVRRKSLVVVKDRILDDNKSERTCKRNDDTPLGLKPDVTVSIQDHELVSGSLFSIGGNITIYTIKTSPFNWVVKRKFNDFIWLRSLLLKMYPGIPIPPLPGKTMKQLDDKLIQRRKGYFESFLTQLLSYSDLKSSKFLYEFLSIPDDKIFKERVRESEKMSPPKNITEIETVSGKVKELEDTYKVMNNMCEIQANSFTDQIKIFSSHFYNFFKFHKDNLTGLKQVVKIRNDLNTVLQKKDASESGGIGSIFRLSKESVTSPAKTYKEIEEQVSYFNEQMTTGAKKSLEFRFKTYSKHFMTYCTLQKSLISQMGLVWQDISEHFNDILTDQGGKKKLEIMRKVN